MTSSNDLWAKIAAPVDPSAIQWRQDGRPVQRDGRFLARFVAYIEAGTVRERLDDVVPGEWDLTLEALPVLRDGQGAPLGDEDSAVTFKARLQVLGVIREDVGSGKDYKQASTDAFKRAAVRFGIGHELYNMERLWVEVDGDGKFARPVEDPAAAYARKYGKGAASREQQARAIGQAELPLPEKKARGPELAEGATARELLVAMKADPDMTDQQREYIDRYVEDADKTDEELAGLAVKVQEALAQVKQRRITDSMQRQQPGGNPAPAKPAKPAKQAGDVIHDGTGDPKVVDEPDCPVCGGRMWDNRLSKRNPKAPDYKCRDRSCDGAIWPERKGGAGSTRGRAAFPRMSQSDNMDVDLPAPLADEDDDLPF